MRTLRKPSIARGTAIRWSLVGVLVNLCFAGAAWGSLLWDPDTVTPGAQGGAGTWNITTANWWDGNGDVLWSSAQKGIFSGTAGGTVTVTAGVTLPVATGLQFSTTGYTVTGGTQITLSGTPTITADSGVTATINTKIVGTVGLTKEGSGTLILGGANTYSGVTALSTNAGAVGLNVAGALGTSTATVNGGTTLFIGTAAANTTVANGITLAGGRLGAAAGLLAGHIYSGTITLANATTSTVTLTDVLAPGTARRMRVSGVVTGGGTLDVSGIATGFGASDEYLQLSGNNTFTGTININSGGRVQVTTNVNALSSNAATVNVNGGGFLDTYNTAALKLNNVAVNSGGTLRLAINPGAGSAGTVPTAPVAGTLQIGCAVDTAFDGVKMAGGSVLAGATSGASFAGDMVLQGPMEITTSGFNFVVNGALSGSGGFTKTGANRLQLGGTTTNNYAGITTVNEGELYLSKWVVTGGIVAVPGNLVIGDGTGTDTVTVAQDENIADTSAVTINSGGKLVLNDARGEHIGFLSGSGGVTLTNTTVASVLTVNDGIAPGSSAGTLTVDGNGALVLGASSNSVFQLSSLAGISDQVLLLGTTGLALAGDLTIQDLGGMEFGNYTLFDLATGPVVGSFANVHMPAGYEGSTVSTASGDVVLTVIPEPATLAMLLLGGLAMMRKQRRR